VRAAIADKPPIRLQLVLEPALIEKSSGNYVAAVLHETVGPSLPVIDFDAERGVPCSLAISSLDPGNYMNHLSVSTESGLLGREKSNPSKLAPGDHGRSKQGGALKTSAN
jgi:hypothetical protein